MLSKCFTTRITAFFKSSCYFWTPDLEST